VKVVVLGWCCHGLCLPGGRVCRHGDAGAVATGVVVMGVVTTGVRVLSSRVSVVAGRGR